MAPLSSSDLAPPDFCGGGRCGQNWTGPDALLGGGSMCRTASRIAQGSWLMRLPRASIMAGRGGVASGAGRGGAGGGGGWGGGGAGGAGGRGGGEGVVRFGGWWGGSWWCAAGRSRCRSG